MGPYAARVAPQRSNRFRLVFAGALAAVLAALVVGIAIIGGSGDSPEPVPADPQCVASWNSDQAALQLGRHQFQVHGYERVQVMRLSIASGEVEPSDRGACALAFAAEQLDSEASSAAQVLQRGTWGPVSNLESVTPELLGRLQSEAGARANASLAENGAISPAELDG